jgi:hypothetical protein
MPIRGFLPEEFALMMNIAGFDVVYNQVMKHSPYHFATVGEKRKIHEHQCISSDDFFRSP